MEKYKIDLISLTRIFRQYTQPKIIEVNHNSPLLIRKSLLQCAKYFQREGFSDWCHFEIDEKDYVGYLFIDKDYPCAVGGCLFRKREYENLPPFTTLHWIWLHPFVRNKGLLSEYVDFFNSRFGYWYPEHPHSKAMNSFVSKHKLINPVDYFA